jgi:hypothetical protein
MVYMPSLPVPIQEIMTGRGVSSSPIVSFRKLSGMFL